MSNEKIKLTDSMPDIIYKMSECNPGAMSALMDMLTPNDIDPDNIMGGLGAILLLDSYGIYGTNIYILYSDICNKNLVNTLAVLRACQLGLFSSTVLKDACSRQDYSGASMVPVDELYLQVKTRLPNFNLQSERRSAIV